MWDVPGGYKGRSENWEEEKKSGTSEIHEAGIGSEGKYSNDTFSPIDG